MYTDMTKLKPSGVPVHEGDHANGLVLVGTFGSAEAEHVAATIIRVLARKGDEWRALTLDELWDDLEVDPIVLSRIINPLKGRADLESGPGYIKCDAAALTIEPTAVFIEVLAKRWGTA